MKHFLDIDWLKANHQMIHYFGLGFIQVKLTASERLHFYTPKLPSIINPKEVHNHRYDFNSKILKGTLYQNLVEIVNGKDYILKLESCQPGVEIDDEGRICGVKIRSSHTYVQNSGYYINHDQFHSVEAKDDCITHLIRGDYKKDFAEVVWPVGSVPVCPFSKKVEKNELWEIISDMVK